MTEYSVSSDQMVLVDRKGKTIQAPSVWRYVTPLIHANDPATSHAAAEKCKEFKGRHEARILDCLRNNYPMIAAEIARATGLDYHAVQRRMAGLRANGLIERTGETRHGQHVLRAAK